MTGNGADESAVLFEVLNAYLADLAAGRAPSREELMARHPELHDRLAVCLESLEFLHRAQSTPGAGSTPEQEEGGTIGDYRIHREIGRGGMGVVYEAEQISLRRRVALKVLPLAAVLDPKHLQRFKNEAQAAAHLHHNHIVPVYSIGCERGVHYYAMQHIDGISVADMIAELRATAGRDEPTQASRTSSSEALRAVTGGGSTASRDYCRTIARLGVQAAQALDHAHERGVVHRDIKPANLILDTGGRLWITDFGLASFSQNPGLTMTGDLVGTVRYMSPEQALAKRAPIDHRTDVYSLGTTLYECVTLQAAFPGEEPHQVIQAIATKEPRRPRRINAAVPEELETILSKAMAKDPEDRYETAKALAADLERFLEHRAILAKRPTLAKRSAKWARRHKPVVGTAVVALLLSVVGFAVATLLLAREARRAGANYERGRSFVEGTIDRIASGLTEEPALGSTLRGVLEDALGFFEGSSPVADAREAALDDEGRGRILHALGRHEEAAAALRLALERLSPDGQRLERVRVRRRLAEVHVDWGRHDAAAEAFALALDETEALPAGAARARERTRILYGMGRLCERLERLADADQAYTEALLILDPLLAGDPTNREYRYDIARCCHRLRIVRTRMLGPEAGLELGKRALTLANGLQAEAPDVSRYVQLRAALYMTRLKVEGMLPPWEAEPRPGPVSGGSSTALGPDWMHFQASAIQTSQRTEEPFEVHAYEGTSNLLGGFQAEATVYLFPTVEGMKGTTRYVMRDEEGNELVCQFFGEQDEDTPDFKGTFVIVEATGRYLGARGAGQHEIVEHGRVVELRVEGSIRRE